MHSSRTFQPRLLASPFVSQLSRSRLGLVIAGLLVLGMAFYATAGLAFAQTAPPIVPNPAVRLTHSLVTLSARYQLADSAEQPQLLSQLLTVAVARERLVATLIEDNPGAVLRVAVPAHLRASLPPAVQDYIEEEVELEGVLEILHEDSDTGSRYLYFLEVAGQRFSLHFATEPPDLLTGSRVRVTGVRIKAALVLGSSTTSVQTLAAALPNTFGAQPTLVMLVTFQDNPTQPYTLNDAWDVVFGTTSGFFLENSYQQTWLSGDVAGWYTIPSDSTVCDTYAIANSAKSAASAAGFNLAAYKRYVYAFPQNYACYFWGRSTVGGNPSQAWINGDFELGVTAHELGHGLGLFHSHSMDCGATILGPSCTAYEYGDTLDMMGASSSAHFNAFQKERLGWLDYGVSPPIATVQGNGTYTVAPYEFEGSQAIALKILKSTDPTTGNKTWYYVEYRQALGFDSFLTGNSNVLSGILVHTGSESSANSVYLLDMTPGSGSSISYDWRDPAIVIGQSFSDPNSGVTITPLSVSSTDAIVSVSFDLAVSVSTDRSSYSPNQSVAMTAMVRADGGPVANTKVTLTITKPNGAVTSGTATTGSNGSAVYKYHLKNNDLLGTYQVTAGVSLNGDSSTASTNFTVQ
jgi:MG2 domain-containing protein